MNKRRQSASLGERDLFTLSSRTDGVSVNERRQSASLGERDLFNAAKISKNQTDA